MIGLLLLLVVLEMSKVAFSLSSIISKMDITSVKRVCSEADLDFLGFRYRYIKLASRLRGIPGFGGFVEVRLRFFWTAGGLDPVLDAICEDVTDIANRTKHK